MVLSREEIDNSQWIRSDVLLEIHSVAENRVKFGDTELEIVLDIKDDRNHADEAYLQDLVMAMQKARYKDPKLMSEYVNASARMLGMGVEEKTDHKSKQATRRGKVFKMPHKKSDFGNWDFRCELDLKVGDECWYDAFYTREQFDKAMEGDDKIFFVDDKIYLAVPSQAIFAAKRDGEMLSVNGYILGRVIPKVEMYGRIYLPQTDISKVEVVCAPRAYPEYVDDVWKNTEVEKGDVVYVKEHFATCLDPTYAASTDLVRFQPRVILAKE